MIDDYHPLQRELGYFFNDPSLLQEALRHSSFVNEQPDGLLRNNERLEFLGDAVLNLVIGDLLMHAHQDLREGDLSRLRANLVNERQLAEIARRAESPTGTRQRDETDPTHGRARACRRRSRN